VTAFAPEQVSRRGGSLVPLSRGGTAMTTIETSTAAIEAPGDDFINDDAQLAAVAFLARYSGRTPTLTATICEGSSSGPPTTSCRCSRQRGRTSSSIAAGWKTRDSLHRRLTVASRQCAASTASLTLTVASRRTRRSRCAVHKCTRRTLEASTGPNSACSCSSPSSTTAITPPSRCCSASTGSRRARCGPNQGAGLVVHLWASHVQGWVDR
jgi:hypothetical protein